MLELVIRILYVEGFYAVEYAQHFSVRQRHRQRIHPGHVLKLPYHRRHVMSQYVQLQQVFVYLVIVEMGGDDVGLRVVGRVLYGTKLIYLMIVRDYYYSSRMLSGGALDSRTMLSKPVSLIFVYRNPLLLIKLSHISVSSLICDSSHRTGLENILFSEYRTDILMGYGLILSGKVKIYIRFLIAVKAQECGERNGEAVSVHLCAANGAFLRRHIYSAVIHLHISELHILTFRAYVMRIQRIYFRDAGHGSRKR